MLRSFFCTLRNVSIFPLVVFVQHLYPLLGKVSRHHVLYNLDTPVPGDSCPINIIKRTSMLLLLNVVKFSEKGKHGVHFNNSEQFHPKPEPNGKLQEPEQWEKLLFWLMSATVERAVNDSMTLIYIQRFFVLFYKKIYQRKRNREQVYFSILVFPISFYYWLLKTKFIFWSPELLICRTLLPLMYTEAKWTFKQWNGLCGVEQTPMRPLWRGWKEETQRHLYCSH